MTFATLANLPLALTAFDLAKTMETRIADPWFNCD